MFPASLELQRARKALETFCARHNSSLAAAGARLSCRRHGDELEIVETAAGQQQADGECPRALVRLTRVDALWRVFWARGDGTWEPYPYLLQTDSVETVINELEQAPLHVHWG